MKNKVFGLYFVVAISYSSISFAETFKIPLKTFDQYQLTKVMAKLDNKYRTEEVINGDAPNWYSLKKYNYLNDSEAFYINCAEKYYGGSASGIDNKCEVGFNYALSSDDLLNVHDGFMENFAIAEIKDQKLARDLYNTLDTGPTPSSRSFFSEEQLSITHPATGNKFSVFRFRIECKRDASNKDIACTVYSVK
jgi:hypothetical protein